MLDIQNENERQRLATAIAGLPCKIELPSSWRDFFENSGPAAVDGSDARQFPRWNNRALAGLLACSTFSGLPRDEAWHPIYVKDISRGGVAIIHSEQLYPLEQMRLLFIDDVSSRLLQDFYLRAVEVVWCRRVQANCYEAGLRFVTV